jgi:hypothetical protein
LIAKPTMSFAVPVLFETGNLSPTAPELISCGRQDVRELCSSTTAATIQWDRRSDNNRGD